MKKEPKESKDRAAKRYRLRRSIGVPADVAAAELERIAEKHDGITPKVLVDEARPKDAPFHPAFEWNNNKAGELYRLEQARNIIKAVHVIEDDGTDAGSAFVHVPQLRDDTEGRYHAVARVVSDAEMLAAATNALMLNLESARRGLEDLQRRAKPGAKAKRIEAAGKHVGSAVQQLKKAV